MACHYGSTVPDKPASPDALCILLGGCAGTSEKTVADSRRVARYISDVGHQISTHVSLLARVSDGTDRGAWREFCDRYGELIRGFVLRRGFQAADADDIMQDVLAALTRSMPGFTYDPSKGKFRGYLKTMVIRSIYKKTFQKRPELLLEDIEVLSGDEDELESLWELKWRQYHIRQAMRTVYVEFNEADREAFEQYAVSGLSAQETAAALGMRVNQVYKAKSRILRRLGELIERQVRDEG